MLFLTYSRIPSRPLAGHAPAPSSAASVPPPVIRNSTACAAKKLKGGVAHEKRTCQSFIGGIPLRALCHHAALRYDTLCGVVAENMCKEYLPDRSFQKIQEVIANHYRTYKSPPTYATLSQTFQGDYDAIELFYDPQRSMALQQMEE